MDWIDRLIKKKGGLRAAARSIGVTHVTLKNWRAGSPKLENAVKAMGKARKELKESKSKFWGSLEDD